MNGNENIVHVEAIEGLMSQANEHLDKIVPNYRKQRIAKSQAIEDIDLFQKTTLHDLRVLCEGD